MKKADGNPLGQPSHKDAKDLVEGALVNFLGMAAKISKVLFIFVAAHMYGPTALGVYLLAWSAIDIASKFGLWGIDRSLIRDIARYNIDKSEATKARIFGIMLIYGASGGIWTHDQQLSYLFLIQGSTILCRSAELSYRGMLKARSQELPLQYAPGHSSLLRAHHLSCCHHLSSLRCILPSRCSDL